jgi:hypothetical protein
MVAVVVSGVHPRRETIWPAPGSLNAQPGPNQISTTDRETGMSHAGDMRTLLVASLAISSHNIIQPGGRLGTDAPCASALRAAASKHCPNTAYGLPPRPRGRVINIRPLNARLSVSLGHTGNWWQGVARPSLTGLRPRYHHQVFALFGCYETEAGHPLSDAHAKLRGLFRHLCPRGDASIPADSAGAGEPAHHIEMPCDGAQKSV